MSEHVVVIFVHGILAKGPQYAKAMEDALTKRLPGQAHNVRFKSVYWADLVRNRQNNFMKDARDAEQVINNRLRRFFLEGMGDAAAYQKTWDRKNSIYHKVHQRIDDAFNEFDSREWRDAHLIFIGHSLGCHIISSYVWDTNRLKQYSELEIEKQTAETRKIWEGLQEASPIRRLDTLAGLVTLGSNMPLFTFTFGPDQVFPITCVSEHHAKRNLRPAFPGAALQTAALEQARWLNFFSKRDVLGFPLKPLNERYRKEPRILDICVRSEAWYTRLLPFWSFYSAHSGYWRNRTVLSETAQLIDNIINPPPSKPSAAANMVVASS
jgi:hypothetical protein